jgi:glycosyltransferase involved in cell wall biosynthesis
VLLEASAAGLAIVSTDNNGSKDLITHGKNGMLVPIGDYHRLSASITELLRDPAKAKALGAAAREHVLTAYSEKRLMSQWIEMWRAVAERKTPCVS